MFVYRPYSVVLLFLQTDQVKEIKAKREANLFRKTRGVVWELVVSTEEEKCQHLPSLEVTSGRRCSAVFRMKDLGGHKPAGFCRDLLKSLSGMLQALPRILTCSLELETRGKKL